MQNIPLRTDVNGLLSEAKRLAAIAVNQTTSDAILNHSDGNSRLAFPILEDIESEGARLIAKMIAHYRAVAGNKTARPEAKTVLRTALDDYLDAARLLGRETASLRLQRTGGRNPVLDREYDPLGERLKGRLEREMRLVDAEPQKRVWERYPLEFTIGTLLALAGLIVSIVTAG